MKTLIAALALGVAAVAAAPAMAQPPGQYRDWDRGRGDGINLSGLSVDQAKQQLSYAGYNKARSIKINGQQYDLWANARSRDACVGFTSRNGTVTDVRDFDDSECGLYGNGNNGGWGGGPDRLDLRGLSVDQAKQQLSYAGYNKARSIKISGQQWDLWLSNRGRDCVGFTSYKGRVTDTRSFRNDECGGGYNDGGWSGGGGWGGGFGNPDRLVGLSVDQAKNTLANAGFQKARSTNIYGKQWDLWFDDRSRGGRCVGFTSLNGRVSNADTFDDQDCY